MKHHPDLEGSGGKVRKFSSFFIGLDKDRNVLLTESSLVTTAKSNSKACETCHRIHTDAEYILKETGTKKRKATQAPASTKSAKRTSRPKSTSKNDEEYLPIESDCSPCKLESCVSFQSFKQFGCSKPDLHNLSPMVSTFTEQYDQICTEIKSKTKPWSQLLLERPPKIKKMDIALSAFQSQNNFKKFSQESSTCSTTPAISRTTSQTEITRSTIKIPPSASSRPSKYSLWNSVRRFFFHSDWF